MIGASRITYSMASYRQLPERFRRLHPRFKTPWLALVVFAGFAAILALLPGQTDFLGHDLLVRRDAVVHDRPRLADRAAGAKTGRGARLPRRPNVRFRGIDWPLFAILGGLGTGIAWLVVVIQEPLTRWAGLAWLALGFAVYAVYRGRVLQLPLRETVRAPAMVLAGRWRSSTATIVVPVMRSASRRRRSSRRRAWRRSAGRDGGGRPRARDADELPLDRRPARGGGGEAELLAGRRARPGGELRRAGDRPAWSARGAPARRSWRRPWPAMPSWWCSARRGGGIGAAGPVFGHDRPDTSSSTARCRVLGGGARSRRRMTGAQGPRGSSPSVLIVLGVAVVVRTIARGRRRPRLLLGGLMIVAGALRLWILGGGQWRERTAPARVLGARSLARWWLRRGRLLADLRPRHRRPLRGGRTPWVLLAVGVLVLVVRCRTQRARRRCPRPAAPRRSCGGRSATPSGSSPAGCCSSTTWS